MKGRADRRLIIAFTCRLHSTSFFWQDLLIGYSSIIFQSGNKGASRSKIDHYLYLPFTPTLLKFPWQPQNQNFSCRSTESTKYWKYKPNCWETKTDWNVLFGVAQSSWRSESEPAAGCLVKLGKSKKKDITLAAHFFVCFFLVCWSVGGASYWQLQTIGWAELRGAEGCWMFGQNTENQKYLAAKPSSWCFGCVVG